MRRAISILALFFAAIGIPLADGHEPDVASPLVSYQFFDSISEAPDQPNVVSPLVSYQYFDWLGDENLTFQNSPAVSYYFYNGPSLKVTGVVRTGAGVLVPGAVVTLKQYGNVFRQVTTNRYGAYTASGLPADNYMVNVTKSGYLTKATSINATAGGNQKWDFQLDLLATPVVVESVNRLPVNSALGVNPPTNLSNSNTPRLKVFNGSVFIDYRTDIYDAAAFLKPSRTTIILTHGWNSNSDDWPKTMAQRISTQLGDGAVNIVAWDWHVQADTFLPSSDRACTQGELLGKALLQSSLGSSYVGHVHFIGHSMGTIVNSTACDYVHGAFPRKSMNPASHWESSQTRPHITLLDEAGVVSNIGNFGITVNYASKLMSNFATKEFDELPPVNTEISWNNGPIPRYSWIDNYMTEFGWQHKEAVNVKLQRFYPIYFIAHSDAHEWYNATVSPPGPVPAIGFNSSFESAGVFPPTGEGRLPGSLWYENLATSDPLDLFYVPDTNLLSVGDDYILKPALKTVNDALNGYGSSIQFVGNIGGGVIYKTGNVVTSATEKIGLMWDAASDKAADILNSISPDNANTDKLTEAVLRLQLSTFSNQPLNNQAFPGIRTSNVNSSPVAGQPAHAWFTVDVPKDAAMLAFDFTVTGEPVKDKIACAVNDKNVFALSAKFAPDGETVSTDLIDISRYAGQTVELFFGLTGGTSTNCGLAIDGIRFVTIPKPQLAVSVIGNQVRLQWPAAATGWVPQRTRGGQPANWIDVTLPETMMVENGIVTLDTPQLWKKEFFRLKRVE